MNKKAETFQASLDERNIKVFSAEEIKDDQATVVFRSHIAVDGTRLPMAVILDNSIYGIIRVQVAPKAEETEALLKLLNTRNSTYKPVKYYLTPDGQLILDVSLLFKEDADCDLIYAMIDFVVRQLTEGYKDVMKAIWA